MDAACSPVYILLVPGIKGHQWLIAFRRSLSLVTLGDRLQILSTVVQIYWIMNVQAKQLPLLLLQLPRARQQGVARTFLSRHHVTCVWRHGANLLILRMSIVFCLIVQLTVTLD